MTNYEYMAMGRKLCKADQRSNTVTGLVITTVVLGGYLYLQYRMMQEQNKIIKKQIMDIDQLNEHFKRQSQTINNLTEENRKQRQAIIDLERTNQVWAKEIKDSNNQKPQA